MSSTIHQNIPTKSDYIRLKFHFQFCRFRNASRLIINSPLINIIHDYIILTISKNYNRHKILFHYRSIGQFRLITILHRFIELSIDNQ